MPKLLWKTLLSIGKITSVCPTPSGTTGQEQDKRSTTVPNQLIFRPFFRYDLEKICWFTRWAVSGLAPIIIFWFIHTLFPHSCQPNPPTLTHLKCLQPPSPDSTVRFSPFPYLSSYKKTDCKKSEFRGVWEQQVARVVTQYDFCNLFPLYSYQIQMNCTFLPKPTWAQESPSRNFENGVSKFVTF